MTYANIAAMQADGALARRLAACAAQQNVSKPETWVALNSWKLAAEPGWDAAWSSALAANTGNTTYEPGSDEGVITDAMILSAVQPLVTG